MKTLRPLILISSILVSLAVNAQAEYSNWSFGGGLDLVYNSDNTVKSTDNGAAGGYQSAPSPIASYLSGEYRLAIPMPSQIRLPADQGIDFAPAASIMFLHYLWANNRVLPAEDENRTAFVPTLFLELPLLYRIDAGRFKYSFGFGPAILIRYGFLESGVGADEISSSQDMPAGEQVRTINGYMWDQGRWFYPSAQIGIRYKLETGWGANFVFKTGFPVSNLWSKPSVPFIDSCMFMAAITITPPTGPIATAPGDKESTEPNPANSQEAASTTVKQ